MKFTDAQFVQAVELLQAIEIAEPGRKNQHRAPRTEIRIEVDIKVRKGNDTAWEVAELRDVSARGLRIQSNTLIQPGDSFLLRLPTKEGNKMGDPLICRVAHCTPSRQWFIIGAEFTGRAKQEPSAAESDAELDRIRRSILA